MPQNIFCREKFLSILEKIKNERKRRGKTKNPSTFETRMNRKDITGARNGKLTALAPSENRIRGNRCWYFRCDCGNDCELATTEFHKGIRTSCGRCSKKQPDSYFKVMYCYYKQNAKVRQLPFEITMDDFMAIVVRPCYYCRAEPSERGAPRNIPVLVNGVDRANSKRGYHLDNCVPCCETCNIMKRDMGSEEFINHTQVIANRSDGNDYSTRTTFVSEANVGDTAKVLLLCIYDLVEKFNMQKAEVTSLFKATLDEHITEVDELTGEES